MTPQSSTFVLSFLSVPWHEAQASQFPVSTNPLNQRKVLTMNCSVPLTTDDLDDLQEIRQGIVGLSAVRLSKNKRDLFLEFVDTLIEPQDMQVLTEEFFRQAARHTCTLSPRATSTQQDFEPAMAIHSDVGFRFDDYDR